MKYLILLLSCSSLFETILAQPSDLALQTIKTLNLKLEECKEELIVEMVNPCDTTQIIIVSHILIVNSSSDKIIHKYFESVETNEWESDAIRLTEIAIDTLVYPVSSNTNAFGIQVKYRGSSHANPYDYETLTLFIPSGDSLLPVLKNLTTYQFSGEWDTRCTGRFETRNVDLEFLTRQTNGFYDVRFTESIFIENDIWKNENCHLGRCYVRRKKTKLKFRNGQYS